MDFSYQTVLATSQRASWQIDDIIGPAQVLDFTRPFMPEALARTEAMDALTPRERLILNQIRGHEYLSIFGLVEEFILPFVLDHARPMLGADDHRTRALLQFATEEAKHIHLFKRFHAAFQRDFGTECTVIGPAEAIAAEVLRHDPLAVALAILHIEWMTQRHYVDSVHDAAHLDPLFTSLLKHHWIEEAQHAKLDTLMVRALAVGRTPAEIDAAIDSYLAIGMFIDVGLKTQTEFNLNAFERATGRTLNAQARTAFLEQQHQAARWTYLGSGMTHPKFRETLAAIAPEARDRIDAVAPAFC
jgi:P-aminobenzoate N-oxygenase AurF